MSVIENVALELGKLKAASEESRGDGQFRMAKLYCKQYEAMAAELKAAGEKSVTPQKVNRKLRAVEGYAGPGSSFLSHSKRTFEVFPELFGSGTKKNFGTYRLIANASIPAAVQKELAKRLEDGATREEIREKIREETGSHRDCDFKLQVSNCWRFGKNPLSAEFDGGIHPELVANLIHQFSDTGDHIIDPMAGGGTTGAVLSHYKWFTKGHEDWPMVSGPRTVEMFDAAPTSRKIRKHNIFDGPVPCKKKANLIIFDPPYWGIAEGKYETMGSELDAWLHNIHIAFKAIREALADGGFVCAIVDDFQRAGMTVPLFYLMAKEAEAAGLALGQCIYNAFPNYVVSMGPAQMHRCKKARVLVNEMKTIGVFVKGGG